MEVNEKMSVFAFRWMKEISKMVEQIMTEKEAPESEKILVLLSTGLSLLDLLLEKSVAEKNEGVHNYIFDRIQTLLNNNSMH